MIDETAGASERSGAPGEDTGRDAGQAAETAERVGFCQQCGRPLTAATVRRVGSAVFCEPCLVARLEGAGTTGAPSASAGSAGQAGWTPVGSTGTAQGQSAAGTPEVAPPGMPGEPNPALAAVLGLIPGVGAMYNGQYAKGVAHLVIFLVLVSLSNDVNGIFGLFVAGWIFYQAFEAYHTAKARRDGMPLPNPFGLNDIGDRMGFGKNWPGSVARPVTTATTGGWAATGTAATPPGPTPNWAGYVPPTHFGASAPPPSAASSGNTGPQAAAWNASQYTPPPPAPQYGATYTGEPWQTPGSAYPVPPGVAGVPGRRFPAGAFWLIGLGVLFLLSNLAPGWRLRSHWLVPILLAALGLWLLFRRIESLRAIARLSGEVDGLGPDSGRRLACQLRAPVILLVLAVLFAVQAAGMWTLGQSWPWILIALGGLLLLERSMGRVAWYPPVTSAPGAAAANPAATGNAGAGTSSPRATWTTGEGESRKDGQ